MVATVVVVEEQTTIYPTTQKKLCKKKSFKLFFLSLYVLQIYIPKVLQRNHDLCKSGRRFLLPVWHIGAKHGLVNPSANGQKN